RALRQAFVAVAASSRASSAASSSPRLSESAVITANCFLDIQSHSEGQVPLLQRSWPPGGVGPRHVSDKLPHRSATSRPPRGAIMRRSARRNVLLWTIWRRFVTGSDPAFRSETRCALRGGFG